MTEAERDELFAEIGLCPKCGRVVPPKDLDPEKLLEWLLRNDPLVRSVYNLGRHEERERTGRET
jgi:hypothetical protein